MLLAFKTKDANGNGVPNDEIPLMGAFDTYGSKVDTFLLSAFVYTDGENRLSLDNKKVTADFMQNEFQEGLRYLNQLYSEDLLARDSFTATRPVRQQLNSSKYESIIGAMPNIHHGNLGSREASQPVRWIDYEAIAPLKGPKGLQVTRYNYYGRLSAVNGFVPVTSKNPALVVRWLDWFGSEEGTRMAIFGEKGRGWTDADAGSLGLDGRPATWKEIVVSQSDPYFRNASWGQTYPTIRNEQFRLSQQAVADPRAPDGSGVERFLYDFSKRNYAPYGLAVEKQLPPLYYSNEDAEEMALLQTNVNTYVDESIAKFVIGELNIDRDWNTFQTNLKNLGIDRYLSILQKTFDASAFAKK
jgi:putative aldouronate transport system substrate-binding protein